MKFKTLFVFTVFLFGLFFLFPFSAKAVSYTTGCGETFSIGDCWPVCCEWECCGWDEEGGCTDSCCVSECTECSCSGIWDEFNANTNSQKPDLQIRGCESVCGSADDCCTCGPCVADCTSPEVCKECGSWQEAVRSCTVTSWGLNIPKCKCNADYIDKPSNPRYYNNSDYPTDPHDPEEDKDSDSVLLPVKLDWDDIRGWVDGWKENDTLKSCSDTCPEGCYAPEKCYEKSECSNSYVIRIEGEEMIKADGAITTSYTEVLDKSEFIAPNSCFFKSGKTYTWHVKACCDAKGKSCGPESTWTFITNTAPELMSPYDEDWNGPKNIGGTIIEGISSSLKWCKIEDSDTYQETIIGDEKVNRPLSYKVLLYHSEDDLCYEQLYSTKECPPIILAPDFSRKELLPPDEFLDTYNFFFTKDTTYAWKISACKDTYGENCTDYSQLWRFETGEWKLVVFLNNPDDDSETPLSLPITLAWDSSGANSYNYKLYGVSSGKTQARSITFNDAQLSLDTVYRWSIQPCSDYESEECEDLWGGPWYFKTTGGQPNLISPTGNNISIPTKFDWQEVGGAKSYVFKIFGGGLNKEIPTEETTISLDYPDLKQEVNYTWQVKTCAKTEGKVCGSYSNPQTFKTFKLEVPHLSYPKNNENFFTYQKSHILDWEQTEGGDFYEYEVNFTNVSDKETNQNCKSENIVPQEITENTNSVFLNLTCLGDYQWKIRSCLDKDCQETSDWGNYNFSFVQGEEPSGTGGIVPCGRTEDDAKTPWNEREDCQIKHIFLLMRNIIDFVLWTLAPLAIGILVLGTGLMFYFSIRFQDSLFLTRIKLVWKAAGIGYGILFLSWIVLNLFLGIIGFQVGIFGNWWQTGF